MPSDPPRGTDPSPGRVTVGTETAYLTAPAGPGRATILVLHAWWGLTPVITKACDLTELGYVAVAPTPTTAR